MTLVKFRENRPVEISFYKILYFKTEIFVT